ncbi:putative CONSERVED INTEGRAL MEMBRANE PROTEIN [Pseudonocardia sp. Ae168_Ps1]|uniref:DUF4233 domain-containing protein n=1 Tax=unclassified Pseudonocardia TaxID=2619320 RepID=UPI00095D5F18|nr:MULTISPECIES: DUF4233 domain-containing protein [unclassified Pseudonocardia]OLL73297.1 putative CONSERVED INTEGRAL MEMBRANE PROTEIN [Pseudonocardia sp. Ae150A_Ps1]OLL79276.1 putative CONSERVED INTEGRAL MEMBRANE PROTEIN [Pseudonocardia sp. Ae168_Ps1]OLL86586.1 putative CONSERVED INTEGRAL MEMBRANE PROTEIN [Pseudonocardia sp. Ae263_Ps1]OLL93366.1 putative CONSERVED INTEGRAL MEMBRANE PROTEIN [Pseudonocardia sp. Ae356_Ps1]
MSGTDRIDGVPEGVRPPPTDPMKGARGVFAATLILEAIVVLLALLVLPRFGSGSTALGAGVITALAVAMILLSGLQRRSWGLGATLALQVLLVVASFVFVPSLAIVAFAFVVVFAILLWMRREVARRMAAGTLPSQQEE